MPTASNEAQNLMKLWFGDSIDDQGPTQLLKSHGFVLRRDWQWEKPALFHTISEIEWTCIMFLIEEWDFGGVYIKPLTADAAHVLK